MISIILYWYHPHLWLPSTMVNGNASVIIDNARADNSIRNRLKLFISVIISSIVLPEIINEMFVGDYSLYLIFFNQFFTNIFEEGLCQLCLIVQLLASQFIFILIWAKILVWSISWVQSLIKIFHVIFNSWFSDWNLEFR